jgi:hypothetical protein
VGTGTYNDPQYFVVSLKRSHTAWLNGSQEGDNAVEKEQRLEKGIDEWRISLQKHPAIESVDVEELEDHLRSQIEILVKAGLDDDEAFFVAVKRMGDLNSISREFAQEYTERLWKQFVSPAKDNKNQWGRHHEAKVVIVLAILAAISIKTPEIFGKRFAGPDPDMFFYARNFSLFVLPFLSGYFVWKRSLSTKAMSILFISFFLAALIVNLLPFTPGGSTEKLVVIHLPIALWFVVGFSYAGQGWQNHDQRMNFIRFSGEWFIYYCLIALGGAVLIAFIIFTFKAIELDAELIVNSWVFPCGITGAVLICAWLVEAKQSIIENMAPVLTRIFTPLFVLLLFSFLATMLLTQSGINVEREVLIGFDLLLVIVLGLLFYSISARDSMTPPDLFDVLQLLLVISALLVDILALLAILQRISEFGFSPNKVAALGLNMILIVNLGWSAVLLVQFLMRRSQFVRLAKWQTVYIPVYAGWAVIVTVIFPMIFNYR